MAGSLPASAEEIGLADQPMATLSLRVRCETLGYGESVFLVPAANEEDPSAALGRSNRRGVPLYTTASSYPWYSVREPLTIALPTPPRGSSVSSSPAAEPSTKLYTYRYAIYRAGTFHRYEAAGDAPADTAVFHQSPPLRQQQRMVVDDDQMGIDDTLSTPASKSNVLCHAIPLRLFTPGEAYIVSDVLGVTTALPEIERVMIGHNLKQADSLLSRGSVGSTPSSASNMLSGGGGSSHSLKKAACVTGKKTKKVNFAPSTAPVAFPRPHFAPQGELSSVNLTSSDGLVVASAFLPVHLHRSDGGEWTAHWDYEALLSMETHLRVTRVGTVKWRGWHGNRGADGSPEAGVPVHERWKVEECLRPFNCVPVWIDTQQFGEMYNGFCKGVLWPILHNVTSVYSSTPESGSHSSSRAGDGANAAMYAEFSGSGDPRSDLHLQFTEYSMDDVALGSVHGDGGREAALWSAFTAVNRQFADVIIQNFNSGDMVWIHGFHLMILPSYLVRRIPIAKIGLFLHTPFPSSEIFRTLWCREDLLRGMLNADQVGFHLFEYARHFLTCCRRLLGLTYGMIPDSQGGYNLSVETGGRNVAVTSIHAGVEPPIVRQFLHHSVTTDKAFSIRNQFKDKVIFCSIDRMERLKGIPLKMLGLERFLLRCPQWVGKVVLLQVGISAFERKDDYERTKSEVQAMVDNINRRWPGTIQFQECSEAEMRLQQRMALLRASDVCMVTSLRDGLNRIPLEFTMAHLDALSEQGAGDGRKRGICILSEFSSCTRIMRGALHINPWKISQIANAFHQALNMSREERLRRISTASEFVTRVTTQRWALAVLLDLKSVQKNVDGHFSTAGLGLGFRILGMDTGFYSLDGGTVAKAFKTSRHRLILLDYGGTILSNDNLDNFHRYQMVQRLRMPSLPTKQLLGILGELCEDKRNTVFVVSGKERHQLSKALGSIPNLGLAAEHGMFVSWPTSKPTKRKWESIVPDHDSSWRPLAITIMEVYTSRTHGSYIEETEMKVLWQYRDADPEFGYMQSRELEDHLWNVLRGYPVEVLHGGMEEGGYVEVRPKGVNKGVLSMHVIQRLPKKVDFALVIGDDHCDEPMLSVMRQIGRKATETRKARRGEGPLDPLPASVPPVDVSPVDDFVSPDLKVFTCTVGKKPSAAANYLNTVDEVHELLLALNKMSAREQKHYSHADLRTMGKQIQPFPTRGFGPELVSTTSDMKRSSSLGRVDNADAREGSAPPIISQTERHVSANLQDFLGTIQDDDDDEAPVFF